MLLPLFLSHHQQSLVRGKSDQLADTAVLPLLLPVWLATQLLAPTQGTQCTIISVDAKRRLDCPFQQQLQALRVIYDNKPGKVRS